MVPWIQASPKPWLNQVQKPWLKQNQHVSAAPAGPKGWQGYGKGCQSGGGKGKGWQSGFQNWPSGPQNWTQRKPPPSVPQNFQVDIHMRYMGTVSFYHKWKGYGFIDVTQKGVVPQDRLFVHWRNIQSDDRYPFLVKGVEVEFGVQKWQDKFNWGVTTLRAKEVSLVGGTNIAMQDDVDAQEKEFVGGQHLRYTGTLKFFAPGRGFGYVTMDQGYDVPPDVPLELKVETVEVNASGQRPMPMRDLPVEFGIYKRPKGATSTFLVYNMTLPGGHPLTQDALENRITMGSQSYSGSVAIWNWRQGWGFIRADPMTVLPPRVVTKLAQQQQAAIARGRKVTADEKMFYFRRADCLEGLNPARDMQVTFQLYIDDKGVGACEVVSFE
jgi:cold shock CspA family protein